MLFGTNLKYAKAFNFRIVLETIRLYGPISRAEVARRTELTAQTITNITRELLESNLILETEQIREGRGAPSTGLQINPEGAFTIGLDLDQDHLTSVLVDLEGQVKARGFDLLNAPTPPQAMDIMEKAINALLQEKGLAREKIWGVGIGLPGPFSISDGSVTTSVINPSGFPDWHRVPIVSLMHKRLNLPVFLENNATAAAIGEHWYGEGKHIKTFFYLFFGSGLGGGLVMNGHPYEGFSGNAGELGYIPTWHGLAPWGENKNQHVGMFFNLKQLFQQLKMCDVQISDPQALAALYEAQNPCLMEWLDTGAKILAPALLSLEYLLDPQAIFFGGRLPTSILQGLMDRIENILPKLRIPNKAPVPSLLQGTAGVDAAALGVATLPIYEFFAPAPSVLMRRLSDGSALEEGF